MSGLIDKQYINYISGRLERFRWIRPHVAVCRCPFCGDGQKGTKTRFYIYQDIKHSTYLYNVDCKNCGVSMSFHNFLKDIDPGLFREYRLEKFRDKHGREPRQMFSEMAAPEREDIRELLDTDKLDGAIQLTDLPKDHPCVKYVLGRKIPEKFLDYLLYTDNFQQITADFKDAEYAKKMPEDARLIIPFYNEFGVLNCYQGRSLDPDNRMRYITVKRNDHVDKTFGMDRVDRAKEVRVCEGPIDSLFIHNCLASADADLLRVKGDVYIYDAQYRNADVVRHINKAIESNVKLVLFPKDFEWKDINDAVKDGGLTSEEIETLIKQRTFQGLRAKLEFSKLRGC
jgi:hypothetical protein